MLKGQESNAFWISYLGRPLADHSVYQKICKITERELGRRLTPHLFRNCLASSQAIEDPDHVRAAAPILGHADFRTTERFYIQAETIRAGRNFQAAITGLRKRLKAEHRKRKPRLPEGARS